MKIKDNLAGITTGLGRNVYTPSPSAQIGRVYGVVTTPNTPTQNQYERAGGETGIGTIFYLDYESSKDIIGDNTDDFLNTCQLAKSDSPNVSYFPLKGELVLLDDYPSAASQISTTSIQKYYSNVINIWNNIQHNSQPAGNTTDLGISFTETNNLVPLLKFEGDYVLEGRKGNAIRFGSTTQFYSDLNEWSLAGNNGSPILIFSNGYKSSGSLYSEQINDTGSFAYFTSDQKIPLNPDRKDVLNPITKPLQPNLYTNYQILINSDRIVINSRKNEVMLFAKTNIEISTNNIINLNSGDRTHINSPRIFLGTKDNKLPTEPIMLGNVTVAWMKNLVKALHEFSSKISEAITPPQGAPLDLNGAATGLSQQLQDLTNSLSKLNSKISYTA